MASTNRDFKSFLSNFSRNLGEAEVPGVPAPEFFSSTPAHSKTQAVAPALAAPIGASIVKLVDAAYELHQSANGSTVGLADGDMVGQKLFSVSVYPKRCLVLNHSPSWQDIYSFVVLNQDLIQKSAHAFGSWPDESRNVHVLDVVICVRSRLRAIVLGLLYGQTSVYDLAARQEIAIKTAALAVPGRLIERVLRFFSRDRFQGFRAVEKTKVPLR